LVLRKKNWQKYRFFFIFILLKKTDFLDSHFVYSWATVCVVVYYVCDAQHGNRIAIATSTHFRRFFAPAFPLQVPQIVAIYAAIATSARAAAADDPATAASALIGRRRPATAAATICRRSCSAGHRRVGAAEQQRGRASRGR
jgi:hypothetical protein